MKLAKSHVENFSVWAKGYFREKREGTSEDIWNELQQFDEKLCKALKRAGKNIGPQAYIGRHLLKRVTKKGWLIYQEGKWIAQPPLDQCYYCFSPISDIYFIDINLNRYCDLDCLYELDSAKEPCDGYWEDYTSLFEDFSYYHCLSKDFPNDLKPTPKNHLELIYFLEKFESWFEVPDYSTIYLNGGDDGPVTAEMFRMLMILGDDLERLKKLKTKIKETRPEQNYRCHLIINLSKEQMKNDKQIQEFVVDNELDYCEEAEMWISECYMVDYEWKEELSFIIEHIEIFKTLGCPNCDNELLLLIDVFPNWNDYSDRQQSYEAIDGFEYCGQCYEKLHASIIK